MSDESAVTLLRPTGPKELALVAASGFKRWPLRLPDQSIFYPVTNEGYAVEIAQKWNVRDSGFGAVTRFNVKAEFMRRFQVQQVGASQHRTVGSGERARSSEQKHRRPDRSHPETLSRARRG